MGKTKPSADRIILGTSQTPDSIRQLKLIAAEQGTTMQALIAEGLNKVFVTYGRKPIAKP